MFPMGKQFYVNGKTIFLLILIVEYIIVILEKQYFFSKLSHVYSIYTIEICNLKVSQWDTMKNIIYKIDNLLINVSVEVP